MPVKISRGVSSEAIQALAGQLAPPPRPVAARQPMLPQQPPGIVAGGGQATPFPQVRPDFDTEFQRRMLQQRRESEGWVQQYTAKQRADLAKINQDRVAVGKAMNLTFAEKQQAIKLLDMKEWGINPQHMPPDPKEKQYKPGQNIGDTWTGEDGSIHTREPDGTDKVQVSYEKTRAGVAQVAKDKMLITFEGNRQAYQTGWDKAYHSFMGTKVLSEDEKTMVTPSPAQAMKWMRETYPPYRPSFQEMRFMAQEKQAAETAMLEQELQKRAADAGRRAAAKEMQPEARPEPQAVVPGAVAQPPVLEVSKNLRGWTRNIRLPESTKDLPYSVRLAAAFLESMKAREVREGALPREAEKAIEEAMEIGRAYRGRR